MLQVDRIVIVCEWHLCVCVLIVDVASTRFCNGQTWYYPHEIIKVWLIHPFESLCENLVQLGIRGSQHVELQGHINWNLIE